MKTITLEPIKEEVMSPKKFLKLSEEQKQEIESIKIIPPKLGSRSFGQIKITLKHPRYAQNR